MGAVMAAVIDGVLVVGRGVAAVEADCGEVLAVDPQAKSRVAVQLARSVTTPKRPARPNTSAE